MNGHQLQSIRIQDVALVPHPSADQPVLLYIGEEGEAIGCKVCGMAMDEALKKPCPCSERVPQQQS
jgi:hypothetical protein